MCWPLEADLAPCLNHWMGREGAYLPVCADFWNRTTSLYVSGGGGGRGVLLGGVGWSKSSGVCWSLEQNKFPGYMGRKGWGGGGGQASLLMCAGLWSRTSSLAIWGERGGGGGAGKSSGVCWSLEQNKFPGYMGRWGGGGAGKSSGVCWSLEQNKFPGYMGRWVGGGGGGKSSGVCWSLEQNKFPGYMGRWRGGGQVFWCVLVFGAEQVPWLHGEVGGGGGGGKSSGVCWSLEQNKFPGYMGRKGEGGGGQVFWCALAFWHSAH